MTATAADIPWPFDVVINGSGFILASGILPSLPFRTQRANYGFTPTFLTRSNVSGSYGDDQQDFWLTASQRDFSLGEDSKFFHGQDADSVRSFWLGSNVNVTVPGQVSLERAANVITFSAASSGSGAYAAGSAMYTSSTTNLFEIASDGTITDRGAHGCGGTVTAYTTDGAFLFISGAACTKTRAFDVSAHTFADWSATPQDSLTFLNNTVYGVQGGKLYSISTTGTATDVGDFKDGKGNILTGAQCKVAAYGGKVYILRYAKTPRGPELWQYDGVASSKLGEFPPNFRADDFCVASGIVFIIGLEGKVGDGYRTAIYYAANGNVGRAWANVTYSSGTVGYTDITPFGEGLLFTDAVNGRIRFYDLASSGVSSVASYTPNANVVAINTANQYALLTNGTTTGVVLFSSSKATSGFVETSIFDFESSLTKLFRGVIVDWVAATDGDGGSVDIAYQVDSIDGAYTNLQTGATSGTEYDFTGNPTGRGISIKVTINKGTSTLGPTVKRVYVRAAPRLTQFRTAEYVIDCTGRREGGEVKTPVLLRDGRPSPVTGMEMAVLLEAAAMSSVPITIIDRLGTFIGIVEPDNFELLELRPEEFYCRLKVRQV